MIVSEQTLSAAIRHAVNCESIDAKLNTPDHVLGDLLAKRVLQHLKGETDVQRFERGERP